MSNLEICQLALSGNALKFVEYVRDNQDMITKPDEGGRTALHWSAYIGNLTMVQCVINHDNDVDRLDDLEWTPLMISVSAGRDEVAHYLLTVGANVNHVNKTGQTCLHYAASKNRLDLAAHLLVSGAIINVQDYTSQTTPLHRAVSKNQLAMTLLLLDHGADVNIGDIEGNTVLHYACEDGEVEMVAELLKRSAGRRITNKIGLTALELVKGAVKSEIRQLFEQ